ncbi:MAG: hypothetical protein ABEI78_00565 [Candidatus Nanohaloarchaea archaeon]
MILENKEKNCIYAVYNGELEDLAKKITDLCIGKFDDRCEIYSVSIERENKEGSYWKVHEFSNLDDNAVRAVKNHLSARRDAVRVELGDTEKDYNLEFLICKARNTGHLSRYVKSEDSEEFSEDDLIVLSVDRSKDKVVELQREFLEDIIEKED